MVKLGTISKGTADVFSYDEDDFVDDPNLETHLRHFGINMDVLEKTEKSTLELELDMNKKYVFLLSSGPSLLIFVRTTVCYASVYYFKFETKTFAQELHFSVSQKFSSCFIVFKGLSH